MIDYARRSYWGGRHSNDDEFSGELYLTRIPLNSQGYTKGKYPRYYGTGQPLFNIQNDELDIDFDIRASDRQAAWQEVLRMYPKAKLYRPKRR